MSERDVDHYVRAPASWVLIQTKPAAERRVAEALRLRLGEARKLDVYVPVETVWRKAGHRKAPYERPLIRGYVFAALPDAELPSLHAIEGVVKLVSVNGRPGRIGPAFVDRLREAEGAGRFNFTRSKTKGRGDRRKPGDEVRVVRGPFEGFVAVVSKLKGNHRVQAMLAMFGAYQAVDIDLADLELANPPKQDAA